MSRFVRLCVEIILVICLLQYCIRGFRIGKKPFLRIKLPLINEGNMLSILNNLNDAYQNSTSILQKRVGNDAQKDRQSVGISKIFVDDRRCNDCFLGLHVSRREAYVVSNYYQYFNICILCVFNDHIVN